MMASMKERMAKTHGSCHDQMMLPSRRGWQRLPIMMWMSFVLAPSFYEFLLFLFL